MKCVNCKSLSYDSYDRSHPSWTALKEATRFRSLITPVEEAEKHHSPPALTPPLSLASAASYDNSSLGAMEVRMKALEAKLSNMETITIPEIKQYVVKIIASDTK